MRKDNMSKKKKPVKRTIRRGIERIPPLKKSPKKPASGKK